PEVFDVGSVQGAAEVVGKGIAGADDIGGLQLHVVTGGGGLAAQGGEATGAQLQPFDLGADQVGTGSGFRQDAAVVGGEHRAADELVAVLQNGIGYAELDGAADFGLGVIAAAGVGLGELACAVFAATAVELDAGQGVGVETNADGALSEAGFKQQADAQAGFFAVAGRVGRDAGSVGCAILEIAVHVQNAIEDVEAAVFNKALGLRLCAGEGQLGGTGGHGQCQCAPLHQLHCDCSFGLEEFCCPSSCYARQLFLFVSAFTYSTVA